MNSQTHDQNCIELFDIFNRICVAGAVLQTALSFITHPFPPVGHNRGKNILSCSKPMARIGHGLAQDVRDMQEKSWKYAGDMSNTSRGHVVDLKNICQGHAQCINQIPNICLRYAQDMPKIIPQVKVF